MAFLALRRIVPNRPKSGVPTTNGVIWLLFTTRNKFPFGASTDYDYREEKDFHDGTEADREVWFTALDALATGLGGDFPESQSIALLAAIEEWDWADGFSKVCALVATSRMIRWRAQYMAAAGASNACLKSRNASIDG